MAGRTRWRTTRRLISSSSREVTLPEFAAQVEELGRDGVPALQRAVHQRMHEEVRAEVEEIAPVGTKAKRRGRRLVQPGEYKARLGSSVGKASRFGDVGVLEQLQPGQESYLRARAAHSVVLERGRKAGVSRRGNKKRGVTRGGSRMMGSTKAPQGIFGPSVQAVEARAESILADVIREVDG
jgi:hypothetical protein